MASKFPLKTAHFYPNPNPNLPLLLNPLLPAGFLWRCPGWGRVCCLTNARWRLPTWPPLTSGGRPSFHSSACLLSTTSMVELSLLLPGDGESHNAPLGLFWNDACWEVRMPGSAGQRWNPGCVGCTASAAGEKGGLVTNWRRWRLLPSWPSLKSPWPDCWVPLCSLERMDILISSLAFDDVSEV